MRAQDLHVVAVVSNPCRYGSRYRLLQRFVERCRLEGVQLHIAELAFGERPFAVADRQLGVRTSHELWHKENLVNLMVQRLPADWRYLAWIDADVILQRDGWAAETIHQLQHYDVVQLFSDAIDLGPNGEVVQRHRGFAAQYLSGAKRGKCYEFWHPGFAWAMRRSAFDAVGGLLDVCVLGAADHHMATALIGDVISSAGHHAAGYLRHLEQWQRSAEHHIRRNIGMVTGTILHEWHGKKADRRYVERWDILRRAEFDPDQDLRRDWQGVWQLTNRSIVLRDGIRRYFRQRNEDSIDLE